MPVVEKKRITPRSQTLRKRSETREEKMISALSPNLNVMVNAVRKVGQNIIHDFREVANLQISEKGPGDFVSNADLFSEKKLIELLREARPGYGFLSEECGEIPAAWIKLMGRIILFMQSLCSVFHWRLCKKIR